MGKRSRVTLRDVAERAGVSTTTASFVLSGRHDMRISAATEERVLQAARILDYNRRLAAIRDLPPGAPVIGLISDVVATESFGGEMLRGAIAAASEDGYVVLIADSEGVESLERSAVQALLARGVDRFLYATMSTVDRTVPDILRDQQVVTLNCVDRTLVAPAVLPNDTAAGQTAARSLLDAGHTGGIWLVGATPSDGFAASRRRAGILAALRTAGLQLGGHIKCGWWPNEAREAVTELLDKGWWDDERPTAVIAVNDRVAMGVYQAATAAGLRIPDDLSVVAFDNSDLSRWLHPALSTLDLPYFDLGRTAVELLLAENARPRVHRLPMALRARQSVAACRLA